MITHYQNVLCIEASWLTASNIMTKHNYKALIRRKNIKQVRRGGNGRTALIEYESIPDRFKKPIVEKIGDPNKAAKHQQFRKNIIPDYRAIEYFANYKLETGRYLTTDRAKEYHTNAMFINAINTTINNATAFRKARGGSGKAGLWLAVSEVINDLQAEYQHSLPTNQIRLKGRVERYNNEGYTSLIHRNYGNQNSRKVNEQLEKLILSIYIMKNKPGPHMVLEIFFEFLSGKIDIVDLTTGEMFDRSNYFDEKKGTYMTISEPTVWNYVNNPQTKATIDKKRNDWHYYNNMHRPHVNRHSPKFSLSKISLDDRDLVRPMKDTDGKMLRVKAYYVYDVTSHALIGYSHSKKKDTALFIDCIRDMFVFLQRNDLGIPMEAEVEHHLVNNYKDDLMKAGIVFPLVRWCNAGNSQEKRAEHLNKEKKYGFEKRYQDGIGRHTLHERNRPKQEKDWTEEFGMKIKEKTFTYEELVADDVFTIEKYNNALHPNQKEFPHMTRMDVLKMKVNPDLPKFDEELLVRHIGEKTETSIRRSQYVTVLYQKYQLPEFEVMSRLKPNNKKVTAYYLFNENKSVDRVHLYQDATFIATCEKLLTFNESLAETTELDKEIYTKERKLNNL